MTFAKGFLLCGTASLGIVAAPAFAQDQAPTADAAAAPAANAPASAPGDIIVTARRVNERLQDVPVAVSVVTPATLNSKGVFTPVDLQESAPGLSVSATTSDRNNLIYTIRGQGFAYGTLFPAVITYFAEVPITQLTAGQFFDLSNVQILRGPQGVNFGRVTDGGNVMVTPQKPTNSFGGYVSMKLGNYNLKTGDGALNVPIVPDKVLLRGAFEISRRDGFTTNVANGEDLDSIDYEAYRLGLVIKPTDDLENYTVLAYQHTHDTGTSVVPAGVNATRLAGNLAGLSGFFPFYSIDARGNVVPAAAGLTPLTVPNYVASYEAQLAAQYARGPRAVFYDAPSFDRRKNLYLVNTTTAQLNDSLQLKNIFGFVSVTDFEASNFTGTNGAAILTCHSACYNTSLPFNSQRQLSEEIRLSGKSFNNNLTWSVGGYVDKQVPGEQFENDTINVAILQRDNVQYATTTSKAVYASGEYDLGAVVPGLKINGGVRYTHDTVISQNVTYLQPIDLPAAFFPAAINPPIPHGQCTTYVGLFGTDTCNTYSASFNATTWTAGASYKPLEGLLIYAKGSRGYRPGGVNGSPPPGTDPRYNPEFDTSVEIGIKSDFHLGGGAEVRTNIAAYHDRYTNIQKLISVQVGGVPVAITTNAAAATVQGIELDATFIPFRGLSFGGTFAYTDAKYDKKGYVAGSATDPCNPNSATVIGFCPFNRFNSTPKWQYTLNADYSLPLDESIGKVTVSANYYHQSSVALTDTSKLYPDAIEPAYGLLDANVTWANVMHYPVDLGFFITNVTDKTYQVGRQSLSSSFGVLGYIYGAPRMFGFSVKYRFGADSR